MRILATIATLPVNLLCSILAGLFLFGGRAVLLGQPPTPPTAASPTPKPQPRHPYVFSGYDEDLLKDTSGKMGFSISTVDKKSPPQFLKAGEYLPGTKLKITKFEYKTSWNQKLQKQTDCSELTLRDDVTGESMVLPLNER